MMLSLLTPLFGVVAGALLLHEVITAPFIIGAVAVLVGIFVVNRFGAPRGSGQQLRSGK
jgi:drug/metabolite transporter (DMT)-like permease